MARQTWRQIVVAGLGCGLMGLCGGCLSYGDGHAADGDGCETDADCAAGEVCRDGECQVQQADDWTRCESDSDCLVVTEACCGCFDSPQEPFRALRADRESDWYQRDECDVDCEPCSRWPADRSAVCWRDECVGAICERDGQGQGVCVLERADPFACRVDGDCARADLACATCGCESGYAEEAIRAGWLEAYLDFSQRLCEVAGACALGPYGSDACTERPGACLQGRCAVLGQGCDCEPHWNPVCARGPQGQTHTFPNDCQVGCAWAQQLPELVYRGRCQCQMACDPEVRAACAANGETYGCGEAEVRCNGLDVLHLGACDAGEGQQCGGLAGEACPNGDLYCLPQDPVPDALGTCIRLGSCSAAEHCEGQPLEHIECVGAWTCQDYRCVWECG